MVPHLTDAGLKHLHHHPNLKELRIFGVRKMTDEGIQELRETNPGIEIDLPYDKRN